MPHLGLFSSRNNCQFELDLLLSARGPAAAGTANPDHRILFLLSLTEAEMLVLGWHAGL